MPAVAGHCEIDWMTRRREDGRPGVTKTPQRSKASRSALQPAVNNAEPEQAKASPLNFKVSADFRREFKTYAAQHNKKLNQLLYEAFAALKASHAE